MFSAISPEQILGVVQHESKAKQKVDYTFSYSLEYIVEEEEPAMISLNTI